MPLVTFKIPLKVHVRRLASPLSGVTEKLAAMDFHETERNLNSKFSRGGLQCGVLAPMSERDRGGFHQVVTALVAILVVALTVAAIYATGSSTGIARHKQQANSAAYAAHAEQEIEDRCLLLEPPAMAECIRSIIEATNEHDRDENDLVAQIDMAWFALWMTIISGASVGVTAVGIYYVRQTLRKTAESVDLSRDQMIVENRPWLAVETESVSQSFYVYYDGLKIDVDFGIKNVGRSPALNVYFHAELRLASIVDPTVAERLYPDWQDIIKRTIDHQYSGEVIFPNDTLHQSWKFDISPFMHAQRPKGPSGTYVPWILASVSYRTGVGEQSILHTAVRLRILDVNFSSDAELLSFAQTPIRLERPNRRSIEVT